MNSELKKNISAAVDRLRKARYPLVLTGAGISVESGIPDFRSRGGLWEKYDPEIYASIDSFKKDPGRVWDMLLEMTRLLMDARPNAAHFALTALQEFGLVHEIITQNIDGLHQAAGNRDVIEFHGNGTMMNCISCGLDHDARELDLTGKIKPRCRSCGDYLKPAIIFFGEAIPAEAIRRVEDALVKADMLLVIGTSATVFPVAAIPRAVVEGGGLLVDINPEPTALSRLDGTIHLEGRAGEVMTGLLALVKAGRS